MQVTQYLDELPSTAASDVQLVFAFATPAAYQARVAELRAAFPQALLAGCSSAGLIAGERVDDFPMVATAISFAHSCVSHAWLKLADCAGDSFSAGQQLGAQLPKDGLRHVLLLADGLHVNGSALIDGLQHTLPAGVQVTGGLAGDGERFEQTYVYCNEHCTSQALLAIGLYGEALRIGHGSQGGWDSFGPERLITKSVGNVLYSLDDQPALALYKRYLGEHAAELPASGLKFPLSLRGPDGQPGVVRTILGVNETDGSMTFAGDMPEGTYARLMRANFERLLDGAAGAAERCNSHLTQQDAELAVLISCVGRRMVLGQAVEEEVEAVRATLGAKPVLCGFYSYGEISPLLDTEACTLHNQTMTITVLGEA
ncbi:FIST signal transduction protein [Atopomonas sediminilitoris]|uniref:FIST signal transduction protein n=1 Tax=Atopomonas sediminilitoris TaxID=2919919 RepID=UPI001F4E7CFA|nr:FIST N-terminal domain-containing protein [Atopomonas sediminilitoris]MCJ8170300.1 FIST C-terminal domain-containing protein [Atopomonas sediminilitoris]